MIDPDHIIKLKAVGNPAQPPFIACLSVIIPAVQRISPQLPRCGKSVRRTAGYSCGHSFLIQLKKLRPRPGICAVEGYINGNIPNDLNALFLCVGFQLFPLLCKQILLEFVKEDFILQPLCVLIHGLLLPQPDVILPLCPALSLMLVLYCHIKGIIQKPVFIFLCKLCKFRILLDLAVFKGLP